MQGLTLAAIITAEKQTFMLGSIEKYNIVTQHEMWVMATGSYCVLKGSDMMQGLLTAILATEKLTLMPGSLNVNFSHMDGRMDVRMEIFNSYVEPC